MRIQIIDTRCTPQKRKISMEPFNQLSKRERDVVKQLLEGRSNKLIALSLGITERTVEFHLKNIYAKFQLASRMELALKLRESTVAPRGEVAENGDRLNIRSWVAALREAISIFSKELKMNTTLNATPASEDGTMT